MEEKQIKKYANVMKEWGLSALEIEEQGCRLRLERGAGASQAAAPSAAAAVSSDAAPAAAATQDICSPMVGVFYRAPAENAAPFVQVGDCIHKGDVLCPVSYTHLDVYKRQFFARRGGRRFASAAPASPARVPTSAPARISVG